jgi:predicted SPOUT superfamily RNA methylase MTH1
MHADLRAAGGLPPLEAPHHARPTEWARYREGAVMRSDAAAGTALVDVGLDKLARIGAPLPPGARLTLDLGEAADVAFDASVGEGVLAAAVVPPSAPRERHGLYWGYAVRLAPGGISGAMAGHPFGRKGKYDLIIGTSERGEAVSAGALELPAFRHALLVFGGPAGLEDALARDPQRADQSPAQAFDAYLNTCPRPGTRSIRSEEALLISLAVLRPALAAAAAKMGK